MLKYALETRQRLTASDTWYRVRGYEIPVPKHVYRLEELIDWMSDNNLDQVHYTPKSQDTTHTYTLDDLLDLRAV